MTGTRQAAEIERPSAKAALTIGVEDAGLNTEIVRTNVNQDLRSFLAELGRVSLMALAPVILTAFLTIPMSLGGHPGEAWTAARSVAIERHMT